jgi:hypothetical protein
MRLSPLRDRPKYARFYRDFPHGLEQGEHDVISRSLPLGRKRSGAIPNYDRGDRFAGARGDITGVIESASDSLSLSRGEIYTLWRLF